MLNFLDIQKPQMSAVPKPLKYSDLTPEQFLLNFAKRIQTETESDEAKIRFQTIVAMCRRFRGATPSDLFGYWYNGSWADDPCFADLHGTNIFQSLIRGAEAGYSQARIALEISAKSNNFKNRSVEKIARGIYEVIDAEQWTEIAEQAVFYSSILKLNAYCISRFNKADNSISLQKPDFSPVSYEQGGSYVCPECYSTGEYNSRMDSCPQCGSQTLSILDDPTVIQDHLVPQFTGIPAGKAELVIADGFDVTVDNRSANPADISSCGWVEWRYFAQKNELQKLYGHLKLEGKPSWAYPTRLKVALKKFKNGEAFPETEFEKNQYEVRQIWMGLAEFEDYISPCDWSLGGYKMARGERFADHCKDGMVFGVANDELCFIDAEDKNRRVKSCLWLSDANGFYGLGAKSGLPIQKKINHLDNMAMEGEARSLKGSLIYDPEAVDGAHLEGANTNIPKKADYSGVLEEAVKVLDVTGLSQSSLVFLASQSETMQRVMGIPDVQLGEGDPQQETASGTARIDRNAKGLLVPAKKSEGHMKEGWLDDQLDLIQKFYPPDALKQFGARYGEEWQDDEIQAFMEADLKKAILVEMVDGSEVPESRFDKQMKLRQDITAGFIPMTPELAAKLAQQSGYDGIDVGYWDSNRRVAQKRYNWVKETVASNAQVSQAYQAMEQRMIDPQTGQRATDETGSPIPNPVLMQIMQSPVLEINKLAEDHSQQFQYWAERCRELEGSSTQTDPLLVAICNQMMINHKQATFENAMKDNALSGLSQAPTMLGGKILDQQTDPQPPPVNPAQKVAESISYKDAPPSIQRQIEAQAGMRPASDAEAKAHEATQKPKPPSNPAPAKAAAK